MTDAEVAINAPLAPACFPSRMAWVQYLMSAQTVKTTAFRPFTDSGEFNASFNFCMDCTYEHRAAMRIASRCHPPSTAITRTKGDTACDL